MDTRAFLRGRRGGSDEGWYCVLEGGDLKNKEWIEYVCIRDPDQAITGAAAYDARARVVHELYAGDPQSLYDMVIRMTLGKRDSPSVWKPVYYTPKSREAGDELMRITKQIYDEKGACLFVRQGVEDQPRFRCEGASAPSDRTLRVRWVARKIMLSDGFVPGLKDYAEWRLTEDSACRKALEAEKGLGVPDTVQLVPDLTLAEDWNAAALTAEAGDFAPQGYKIEYVLNRDVMEAGIGVYERADLETADQLCTRVDKSAKFRVHPKLSGRPLCVPMYFRQHLVLAVMHWSEEKVTVLNPAGPDFLEDTWSARAVLKDRFDDQPLFRPEMQDLWVRLIEDNRNINDLCMNIRTVRRYMPWYSGKSIVEDFKRLVGDLHRQAKELDRQRLEFYERVWSQMVVKKFGKGIKHVTVRHMDVQSVNNCGVWVWLLPLMLWRAYSKTDGPLGEEMPSWFVQCVNLDDLYTEYDRFTAGLRSCAPPQQTGRCFPTERTNISGSCEEGANDFLHDARETLRLEGAIQVATLPPRCRSDDIVNLIRLSRVAANVFRRDRDIPQDLTLVRAAAMLSHEMLPQGPLFAAILLRNMKLPTGRVYRGRPVDEMLQEHRLALWKDGPNHIAHCEVTSPDNVSNMLRVFEKNEDYTFGDPSVAKSWYRLPRIGLARFSAVAIREHKVVCVYQHPDASLWDLRQLMRHIWSTRSCASHPAVLQVDECVWKNPTFRRLHKAWGNLMLDPEQFVIRVPGAPEQNQAGETKEADQDVQEEPLEQEAEQKTTTAQEHCEQGTMEEDAPEEHPMEEDAPEEHPMEEDLPEQDPEQEIVVEEDEQELDTPSQSKSGWHSLTSLSQCEESEDSRPHVESQAGVIELSRHVTESRHGDLSAFKGITDSLRRKGEPTGELITYDVPIYRVCAMFTFARAKAKSKPRKQWTFKGITKGNNGTLSLLHEKRYVLPNFGQKFIDRLKAAATKEGRYCKMLTVPPGRVSTRRTSKPATMPMDHGLTRASDTRRGLYDPSGVSRVCGPVSLASSLGGDFEGCDIVSEGRHPFYHQGTQQYCVGCAFANAISWGGFHELAAHVFSKSADIYHSDKLPTFAYVIDKVLRPACVFKFINPLTSWDIDVPPAHKEMVVLQMCDTNGGNQHMVGIWNHELILDSNLRALVPLTKENLDACCCSGDFDHVSQAWSLVPSDRARAYRDSGRPMPIPFKPKNKRKRRRKSKKPSGLANCLEANKKKSRPSV